MKLSKIANSTILVLGLLLATAAFAANKGSLSVSDSVKVGSTQLQPGSYKVAWEGTGSNVEVSIIKGKNVVAKTQARMIDLSKAFQTDAAVVANNSDGSKSLSEIRFGGKKYALAIGGESAKADESNASK
jgi:hypothetical protein